MTTSFPSLHGLKVVDLSRVLAGPMCSMILADHGADVIKVESPQGDDTRRWGPPFATDTGDASYYLGLNRNKRAITLDLSKSDAREVLFGLLQDADVLIENFKIGTLEAWGLGYEDVLAPRFPRLVHCRITGFGADGPLGGLPGYDAVAQALSGVMSVNGSTATGPLRVGVPIVDISTGLYATIGILMALQERQRSGLGQFVDTTLYDCGLSILHPHSANWFLSGRTPPLMGNTHPNVVPCEKFQARDGEVFVVVGNNGQFRSMATVLGMPELGTDERFTDNGARHANREALVQILAQRLAGEGAQDIARRLLEAGVPAGPVLKIDAALTAPHTLARGMVAELDGYRGVNTPVKLSRTPAQLRRAPPAFGQHTEEVLREHGFAPASAPTQAEERTEASHG